MKKYERHLREYTVVGISSVMRQFVTNDFRLLSGAHLSEFLSVVRNGKYYHLQIAGERERLIKIFIKNTESGHINLEQELKQFKKLVSKFTKLVYLPPAKYNLATIKKFYWYYYELLNLA